MKKFRMSFVTMRFELIEFKTCYRGIEYTTIKPILTIKVIWAIYGKLGPFAPAIYSICFYRSAERKPLIIR